MLVEKVGEMPRGYVEKSFEAEVARALVGGWVGTVAR